MKKVRTFFAFGLCLSAFAFCNAQTPNNKPTTVRIVGVTKVKAAPVSLNKDAKAPVVSRGAATSADKAAPAPRKAVAPKTEPLTVPRNGTKNE